VRVSVSHPFIGSPSQSAKPVEHAQTPIVQPWFAMQRVVQFPQRIGSLAMSASQSLAGLPSQSARPAAHAQRPPTHGRPPGHEIPHAPQFIASVAAFTSQPLTALRSQSRNPSAQLLVHEPPEHVVPGQTVVQSPQWLRSIVVLTHASAQHSRPAGHMPHGTSGASTTSGPTVSGVGVSKATSDT